MSLPMYHINRDDIINKYDYRKCLPASSVNQISNFLKHCRQTKADVGLRLLQQEGEENRGSGQILLKDLGWHFLQYGYSSTCVLESPALPGWVIKCSTEWEKNIRRCPAADRIRQVITEDELDVDVPEKALFEINGEYFVLARKVSLISSDKMIYRLGANPEVQAKIASQVCRLILKAGISDTHFGNICMTPEGNVAIVDADSVGGDASALLGLKNLVSATRSPRLKGMNAAARKVLGELQQTV